MPSAEKEKKERTIGFFLARGDKKKKNHGTEIEIKKKEEEADDQIKGRTSPREEEGGGPLYAFVVEGDEGGLVSRRSEELQEPELFKGKGVSSNS